MPANLLIIQTAFIGDVVLTTPLIRAARERLAAVRLAVLVRPDAAELLRHNPCIDEIIPYDKHGKARGFSSLLALARRLRQQSFDAALIPHRSFRSALIAWLARIPYRVGFETSAGRWLLTERVPYRRVHEVERNLDLLRPWEVDEVSCSPELFPAEDDQAFADEFLAAHGAERSAVLIGISPGSIWPTKRWLPERFAEVARRAEREWNARVLLFGGPEDAPLCRQIAEQTGGVPLIAAGRATLLQSAALVSRCDVLISNDSAMAHIAAAMGTRVIALFGPTVPAFGFAPYGVDHRIIERSLPCRPCSRHGGKRCPIGTHECMRGIEVEEVLQAAQRAVTSDK
ncbi:MAG: lipopolysaccharide heptosyltransferase II [Candidatus Latescibacteria bacterium]|nr:lipopolysaccharide heptosyltransferase II [Candidatus Latescibacterota bacterium]